MSGLMYRRHRYYDPSTGQFTQSDPIGIAGGLNTYGVAAGDPISFSDPFGLSANDCNDPKGNSEKIVCKTAEKLAPWQPFLEGATMALLTFGPTGVGEIAAVFRGKQMWIAGSRGLALVPKLPAGVAGTFRGGEYVATRLSEPTVLYRVFDGNTAKAAGHWFTSAVPESSAAAVENLVLHGNRATHVAEVLLPKNTVVYQGVVAGSPTNAVQFYIPNGPKVGNVLSTSPLRP